LVEGREICIFHLQYFAPLQEVIPRHSCAKMFDTHKTEWSGYGWWRNHDNK